MKYYIQPTLSGNRPDAGVKAVADVYSILESIGYKPLIWRSKWPVHAIKYISEILFYRRARKTLLKNDTVLLQWPDYSIKYHQSLYDMLRKYRHVQILIHDINSLREFCNGDTMEKEFFCLAETLIVHTEAMKKYVCSLGVKPENVRVLTSFDYLTDNTPLPQRQISGTVVYAGNLGKSIFLRDVDESILRDVVLNCYGRHSDSLGNGCEYKGIFQSNHVSDLEGSWGLVWDGDSAATCSGIWGEYLQYNSPHKTSLYIVAGLPVIIWKKSALASYIVDNGLGITIESLGDISDAIGGISEAQYFAMQRNVLAEGEKLRHGEHLEGCLQK